MPKPNRKINQRERDICARLKEYRDGLKWSQSDFAESLGLTKDQLASVEYARTPVSFSVGICFCEKFGLNQRWLATGQKPGKPFLDLAFERHENIDKALFSEVFDEHLESPLELLFKQLYATFGRGIIESEYLSLTDISAVRRSQHWTEFPPSATAFYVGKLLQDSLIACPPNLVYALADALMVTHADFMHEHGVEIKKWLEQQGKKRNGVADYALDEVHVSVNSGDVKAQWPLLKKRLQQATHPVGTKSKLAEFLGVKLASVSQWLSSSDSQREPGAETALQMLKFVELQERQTK